MPADAEPRLKENIILTRASSINRALDQIGDMWCTLILQEIFWGINTFGEMLAATGASRGILSNRLKWLESIDCVSRSGSGDNRRPVYHLTGKSRELYDNALMALAWERCYYSTPDLDNIELKHRACGQYFWPEYVCGSCEGTVGVGEMRYAPGPGARQDERAMKTRRRASKALDKHDAGMALYRNLATLLGDRWTSNVIALAYHGFRRFDDFHRELPVATNILADRLKLLVDNGIFYKKPYRPSVLRYEYHLTPKGADLFPYFLTLLAWGDRWCSDAAGPPMLLFHEACGQPFAGEVRCDQCHVRLRPQDVHFER